MNNLVLALRQWCGALGLFGALCLCPLPSLADWSAGDLDRLTQAFAKRMARSFQIEQYPTQFLDPVKCLQQDLPCYNSNPNAPYGYPGFGATIDVGTQLKATDALVMILETPPAMRYFGVTPYLLDRYYDALPGGGSGYLKVFASLTDTVNQRVVGTTGSPTPGQSPFGQLTVFVITADSKAYNKVAKQLQGLDFPASAINLVTLPYKEVPLRMGSGPTADTYSALLRLAFPDDSAAMADYILRAPMRTLKLLAPDSRVVAPLRLPPSRVPGSGTSEAGNLVQARDRLLSQLLTQYSGTYVATENTLVLRQTKNYACISRGLQCAADNSDAIYGSDTPTFVPASRADKVLVVGIDHVNAGKATYISHAVNDQVRNVGVVGAEDRWLKGSALRMARISDPNDPRYALYSQLYALTMSYDCSGEPVCLQIPEPTPEQPLGIPFGTQLRMLSRFYLDPATNTRPSLNEIIPHRTFMLVKP